MKRIISVKEVSRLISPLLGRTVVVGGCFDIIHIGHISFLNEAKMYGDTLVVLLESDASIKKWKGINRPIHTQSERAEILNAFSMIDYIVLLPEMKDDTAYDELIKQISPAYIITTIGDKGMDHKKRQAKLTKSELIEVPLILQKSSSEILRILAEEI
jgi:rfaE bifunctional protein nucleotidyltransferase chain/domain